jgi:hypothetical protein
MASGGAEYWPFDNAKARPFPCRMPFDGVANAFVHVASPSHPLHILLNLWQRLKISQKNPLKSR